VSALINPFASTINDPSFSSVVQLAHFDGTSGTATFTNSCSRGNTFGTTTSALISNTQVNFGSCALHIGSLSQNINAATHADYNFSTNDWTIELWWRPDALAQQNFFDMRVAALTAAWVPTIYMNTTGGDIRYFSNGADRITGANGSIAATTWQHVAVCRKTGTTRMFVGGVQVGSNFTDSNTYVQSNIFVGSAANAGAGARGYYDDLRITNGVGRYSANFTPPTAAFPNQ